MAVRNKKAKGSRNELKTIRLLERAGYRCIKSGGSLGPFDVVGISATDFVLIQCKSNEPPRPAEREALQDFSCPPNCKKLIHVWKDYARLPEVREV